MTRRALAFILLVPFTALTIYAVAEVGFIGLFEYQLQSPAGWQVFADLVVALILVLAWLFPEAKSRGANPWPWAIGTLFTGSIAPLLYLAVGPGSKPDDAS